MPSWAPAITRQTFSIARSVVRAMEEPALARGSIWVRRAETRANSAPTKNALKASSAIATNTAVRSLMRRPPPVVAGSGSVRSGQAHPVDPQAVHVLDAEHRGLLRRLLVVVVVELHGQRHLGDVAGQRDPAELAQHQPRDGVVVLVLGQRRCR